MGSLLDPPVPETHSRRRHGADDARLRLRLRYEAAEQRALELNNTVNEKQKEIAGLQREYQRILPKMMIGNVQALTDLRRGKIPRGIDFPSDILVKREELNTAIREYDALVSERDIANQDADARWKEFDAFIASQGR